MELVVSIHRSPISQLNHFKVKGQGQISGTQWSILQKEKRHKQLQFKDGGFISECTSSHSDSVQIMIDPITDIRGSALPRVQPVVPRL